MELFGLSWLHLAFIAVVLWVLFRRFPAHVNRNDPDEIARLEAEILEEAKVVQKASERLQRVLGAIVLAFCYLATSLFVQQWKLISLSLLAVAAFLAYRIVATRRHANVLRYAARHGYRVCLSCYYSLAHLGPWGRCPECGTPFNRTRTIAEWQRHCRNDKRRDGAQVSRPDRVEGLH